jgi:hypothetical protein
MIINDFLNGKPFSSSWKREKCVDLSGWASMHGKYKQQSFHCAMFVTN